MMEVSSRSSRQNLTVREERRPPADGFVLTTLKAIGLVQPNTHWADNSVPARAERQEAYLRNAHLIPADQDGGITTLLKRNGFLDWREKYIGWGSYEYSEMEVLEVNLNDTEERSTLTIVRADDRDGQLTVREGLQIIDNTRQPRNAGLENRVEEILDSESSV